MFLNEEDVLHTDIPLYYSKNRIFQYIPQVFLPYFLLARFDRPAGILLLALPAFWGMLLHADFSEFFPLSLLFLGGAILVRGAGCTFNDMMDRDFDRHVERTRLRPLAAGTLTLKQAAVFLVIQLALAFGILCLLNETCFWLGLSAVLLMGLYPFMKRWTSLPQLFLGFTFNWGVLMGAAAQNQELSLGVFLLYFMGVLWTLCYDTVYAYQDLKDDMKLGLGSLAIRLGCRPKPILLTFIFGMLLLSYGVGVAAQKNFLYFLTMTFVLGYYAAITVRLDIQNEQKCLVYFKKTSVRVGWGILIALCIGG